MTVCMAQKMARRPLGWNELEWNVSQVWDPLLYGFGTWRIICVGSNFIGVPVM